MVTTRADAGSSSTERRCASRTDAQPDSMGAGAGAPKFGSWMIRKGVFAPNPVRQDSFKAASSP